MGQFNEHSNCQDLGFANCQIFYRTRINFNTADCEEWKELWQYARPSYLPPSSKKLRITLLDKANNITKKECEDSIAEAETVTIVADGWLNMRKDHLVNYIALIPNRKPLFYGNKDTTGFSQTSNQIAGDTIEVIENIGQEKVVAVVSDNACNICGA